MVLTAPVVPTAPLIDGVDEVDEEGDEPRVGVAWVPFWADAQVLKSTPTKPPSRLPQDNYTRLRTWSGWKACRPLVSTSCAWIPLQVIPRQRVSLSVGSLLYWVWIKSEGVTWLE